MGALQRDVEWQRRALHICGSFASPVERDNFPRPVYVTEFLGRSTEHAVIVFLFFPNPFHSTHRLKAGNAGAVRAGQKSHYLWMNISGTAISTANQAEDTK